MDNDIAIHNPQLPTSQFDEVVKMIVDARNKAYRMVNRALIDMYWHVGEYISIKIAHSEWGDGVVNQLAQYIATTIPGIKGFSDKNLWRMKQFYETYREADEKLSTLLREIAPEAARVFRDQNVIEFLGGTEFPHENVMRKALESERESEHRCTAVQGQGQRSR